MRFSTLCLIFACIALVSSLSSAWTTHRTILQDGGHHAHQHSDKQTLKPSSKKSGINNRPIVGILSLADSDDLTETGSIIPAGYVKWLEQAGARVAVVPFNAPTAVLDQLFNGINGLLFTGGGLDLNYTTPYYKTANYLWEKAMMANDMGDVFPVWGTCQGFQLMNILAAQAPSPDDILKCNAYDSMNLLLPLDVTPAFATSRLFGPSANMPATFDGPHPTIAEVLTQTPTTMNLHVCGISPTDFFNNPNLPNFYNLLSTNKDRQGKEFISTVEAVKYPFFAAQWHAERTQFEWDIAENLNHSQANVMSHSYVAQRFMTFVRQSTHTFPTPQAEAAALIYNYNATFNGNNPNDHFPDRLIYEFDFHF